MVISEFFRGIAYFGYLILAINTIIYFKSYRGKSIAFKIFTFYLLFCLIIQLTTSVVRLIGEKNIFLSHYYFVGQFILISIFYRNLLKKYIYKNLVLVLMFLVSTFLIIFYIKYPDRYFRFNIIEIVITSVPILTYCFLFLLQKIDHPEKKYVYISSGILLYLLCSTLLFVSGNIEASIKRYIWYSNVILYLVYQILIFIDWYKNFRKKELSS